jgi:hypothetical protein
MNEPERSDEDQLVGDRFWRRNAIRLYCERWNRCTKPYEAKNNPRRTTRFVFDKKLVKFIRSEFHALEKFHIGVWLIPYEEFKLRFPYGFWTHIGLVMAQKYKYLHRESKIDYQFCTYDYAKHWTNLWKYWYGPIPREDIVLLKKIYYDSCEKAVEFYPLDYDVPEKPKGKNTYYRSKTSNDLSLSQVFHPSSQIEQIVDGTYHHNDGAVHYSADQDATRDATLPPGNISGQTQEHHLHEPINSPHYDYGLSKVQEYLNHHP